jgi:hypothetical protein
MKSQLLKDPYVISAAVMLVAAWLAARAWGWGGLVFAFFLLLYFIVALGIRLDEISRQVQDACQRMDRHQALVQRRMESADPGFDTADPGGCLEDVRARLASIDENIGRLLAKIDR